MGDEGGRENARREGGRVCHKMHKMRNVVLFAICKEHRQEEGSMPEGRGETGEGSFGRKVQEKQRGRRTLPAKEEWRRRVGGQTVQTLRLGSWW